VLLFGLGADRSSYETLWASCLSSSWSVRPLEQRRGPNRLSAWDLNYHRAAEIWQATGIALLFGGIAFVVIAQLHLGASWRIGIEEGSRPGLETRVSIASAGIRSS
jgi:hypothetical protein